MEDEEEEEGEGEGGGEGKAPFLQPGQVTLMRRDQRQSEQGARGGRGGTWSTGGQRETRDRQVKEKHKSRVANHSRKFLADRKRGRGLGAPPRY